MLSKKLKTTYLAISEIILPDIAKNDDLKIAFYENFSIFFESLDKDSIAQLKLLIKVLDVLSIIYTFKKIDSLSIEQRTNFLDKIQNFPIAKIVGGFTGLRSLSLMSFYSMPKAWPTIGYEGSSLAQN